MSPHKSRDRIRLCAWRLAVWIRRAAAPCLVACALAVLLILAMAGWQLLDFWRQNLAVNRKAEKGLVRRVGDYARRIALDAPREILSVQRATSRQSALPVFDLFVSSAAVTKRWPGIAARQSSPLSSWR